jgi:hypothetical protein
VALGFALSAHIARSAVARAVERVANTSVEAVAALRASGAVQPWGAGSFAEVSFPARTAGASAVFVVALGAVAAAAALGAAAAKKAPRAHLAAVFALEAGCAGALASERVAKGVVFTVASAWGRINDENIDPHKQDKKPIVCSKV